jgi:hypothetical protein
LFEEIVSPPDWADNLLGFLLPVLIVFVAFCLFILMSASSAVSEKTKADKYVPLLEKDLPAY